MITQILLGIALVCTCLGMVFIVLMQPPKNEGGNIKLGSAMQEMITVPQISNLLYKLTYFMFFLLILFSFLFNASLSKYYNSLNSLAI